MDKLSVAYQLREPKSKTETAIQCHITVNGKRIVFPTHWKVIPKNWSNNKLDKNSGKFFKTTLFGYRERNQELMSMKLEVEDLFNRFLRDNGNAPSKVEFRHLLDIKFNRIDKPRQMGLFDFIANFIEDTKRRKMSNGKRVTGNTILTTYKQTKNVLMAFEKSANFKVDFDSISLEMYDRFVEYMEVERDYSASNVGKHIKTLKTFLNEALEQGVTSNRAHQSKNFKVIREESFAIALTKPELLDIFNLDLSENPTLERQRDFFIVSCCTGLRFSDASKLNKSLLVKKTGGDYIQVKTQKTGVPVPLPIAPMMKVILNKYAQTESGFPKPYANQNANNYLKEIAKKVESLHSIEMYSKTKGGKRIEMSSKRYELVTTHTARRTFATLWYLSKKVSVRSIMKITGHRTEKSFFTYIRLTENDVVSEFELAMEGQSPLSIVN